MPLEFVSIYVENSNLQLIRWLEHAEECTRNRNIPVFIIGTKCDQFDSFCVEYQTIRNVCLRFKVQYIESSAKLNINVEDLFKSMAREGIKQAEKMKSPPINTDDAIELSQKPKSNCIFQ